MLEAEAHVFLDIGGVGRPGSSAPFNRLTRHMFLLQIDVARTQDGVLVVLHVRELRALAEPRGKWRPGLQVRGCCVVARRAV